MTDRICPICTDGWEQIPGEDDVQECRACEGSGFLGPVIPRALVYGPERPCSGEISLEISGDRFSFKVGQGVYADEVAQELNARTKRWPTVFFAGSERELRWRYPDGRVESVDWGDCGEGDRI